MGTIDDMKGVIGVWGLHHDAMVTMVDAPRMGAIHWRFSLPELPDALVPHDTLTYLLAPGAAYRIRGGRREVASNTPGGVGVVPAGSDGAWTFGRPVDVLHIYLPRPIMAMYAAELGRDAPELQDRPVCDDPLLQALATEVVSAMRDGTHGRLYADTLSAAIGMRLIREHASGLPPPTLHQGGLSPWQVRRVTEYMMSGLDGDMTLGELAAVVQLSSFHFCRAFKQSLGVTPFQWQTQRRIERAQALMADPSRSLLEIALTVGYASQGAFGTAFRRVTGITPAVWRRAYLEH